jgi:hypothetical protein
MCEDSGRQEVFIGRGEAQRNSNGCNFDSHAPTHA